jgi:hypothetical protein
MNSSVFEKLIEAAKLTGLKTYLAALGFIALGVYQITEGEVEVGIQTILGGLTISGFRSAVAKVKQD